MTVRVQAGARREAVLGVEDGVLRIAVKAPPVEGAANRAASGFLARLFGTCPSRVQLVRGRKAKIKTFDFLDVAEDAVQRYMERLAAKGAS